MNKDKIETKKKEKSVLKNLGLAVVAVVVAVASVAKGLNKK